MLHISKKTHNHIPHAIKDKSKHCKIGMCHCDVYFLLSFTKTRKLVLLILVLIFASHGLQLYLWILIAQYLWCLMKLVVPQYFRNKKNLDWKWRSRRHAFLVHVIITLNIYTLMWVTVSCGQKINMAHTGVFPGSQVLYEFCWVSHYAVNEEKKHPSPCPPTLSLGMMRSSEPCLRNTFPATQDRALWRWHVYNRCSLIGGFRIT